jgi:hypothetical protein
MIIILLVVDNITVCKISLAIKLFREENTYFQLYKAFPVYKTRNVGEQNHGKKIIPSPVASAVFIFILTALNCTPVILLSLTCT